MKHRLIFQSGNYRIIELPDDDSQLDDLKGDMYKPECHPDIDPEILKRDERKLERQIEMDGVWGYVLERWNPEVGQGWTAVDSCFGFVGQYVEGAEDYDHYIVAEMKGQMK